MPNHFSPISLGARLGGQKAGPFTLTETAHEPNRTLPRHRHEHANAAFVVRGSFTETFDGGSFDCGPLSLIVKPPGEAHGNRYGASGMRCILIEVDGQLDANYGISDAFHRIEHFRGGPLSALGMRVYREFRLADPFSAVAIEGLMLEMIADLARRPEWRRKRRGQPWLDRAHDLLREEFAEGHTLSSIALTVGVHPTHLAREFRRTFRCTVGEYVRRLRVDFACRRLACSDDALVEIAYDAGFADHSHFTRTFKNATGYTPREYRRLGRSR